jgi:hypothetical protein
MTKPILTIILMLMLCSATAQRSDTIIVWYSPPIYDKDLGITKKARVFTNCIPTHQDTIDFGERLDIEWFERVNSGLQQALDSFRRNVLKGKAKSGHLQY